MKFEYIKSYHQDEDNINLCTEHATAINERENNTLPSLVCRNPVIEYVQNCIVCDNEISLEDLITSLQ